jgi:hypothetical protein
MGTFGGFPLRVANCIVHFWNDLKARPDRRFLWLKASLGVTTAQLPKKSTVAR